MVGYDNDNNALTLGDDDALSVGDYDLEYSSADDEWQAKYDRPIGGEAGAHGEVRGAVYTSDSRVGNYSMEFGDGYDVIDIPDNVQDFVTPTGGVSYAFWVKVDRVKRAKFGDFRTSVDYTFEFQNDGTVKWQIYDGGSTQPATPKPDYDVGVWQHWVATFEANEIELFRDGVSVASATVSDGRKLSRNLILGYLKRGNSEFTGLVDDFRIYSRALTSSEASDLSNGINVTTDLELHYNFEYPETPRVAIDSTGEAFPKNRVPRSTSGSLVPQGLAESVSAGEALADDGISYSSVQDAVDNATGWVFVGPGTFNENITISTEGLTLEGCGYDTLIDGSNSGTGLSLNGSNVTVSNLSVQTTGGSFTAIDVRSGSGSITGVTIENIFIPESDSKGIVIKGSEVVVENCVVENTDETGILSLGVRSIVAGCNVTDAGGYAINNTTSDCVYANNNLENSARWGIALDGNDNIAIGNRIDSAGEDGISVAGVDNIVANNRISDSALSGISTLGTGTLLDDNLTEPSN